MTLDLVIRRESDRRTLTSTASSYDEAKADVDGRVPEGWQKLHYTQR